MGFDDIDLTPDDVRTSLNEIPAKMIPDDVITGAIDDERVVLGSELPPEDEWGEKPYADVTDERVELLWKRRAAREAFHASPTEVRRQALDAVVSYDIQAFRGRLNSKVRKAYEVLGLPQQGSSAAFVDATGHLGGEDG